MSQYNRENPITAPQSGAELVADVNAILAAVLSSHRGTSRPPDMAQGGIWVKEVSATVEEVYIYDGSSDILIFSYNPTSNAISSFASHSHEIGDLSGGDTGDINRLYRYAKRIDDWDDVLESGFYTTNLDTATLNQPEAKWYIGYTIAYGSTYVVQELYDFVSDVVSAKSWRRVCQGGTWSAWQRIYNTQEDINAAVNPGSLIMRDEKPDGTAAQSIAAGTWTTRDLNTVGTNTITGASLLSNEFTLPAGTYEILAFVPAFNSNGAKARLYNVTDSAVELGSTNATGHSSFNGFGNNVINDQFTLAGTKTLRIEQIVATTSNGGVTVGAITNNSEPEIYTTVNIREIPS
tara:strand:- start:18127 stop:19173 length:1047 start_codon:yes stop_codon:yes gene_type:complete